MRPAYAAALLALAGFALSAGVLAAVKPETAIRYRQGVYHAILWNFAPMNAMVRGTQPWDQADFARRAQRLAFYSQQLLEGFPPGSDRGAETGAKPAIWQNPEDFKAKMQAFEDAAADLAKVAAGSDIEASKQAFAQTAEACKRCHEKYRAED
ncbi:cytochrome c prime [Mizugakiibacter sediminis]|uniref:Cytochrome C n=1 Tax=Mizugakiibacter sediminis TaxID=1475481 RepID=A0A0K8QR43_9GAMM|nr:cytochrome c [Mizugakiibacter sediminis]GAP67355.1 cytochrome c prime [Mizugakiibacter sediminis]